MSTVLALQNGAAAKHYRMAAPAVIAATMQSVGNLEFKDDLLAAYCKETGKLCRK